MRALNLAEALRDGYRLIFVDHRGLGRSDRPYEPDAYAMPIRVADAVAVLDELGVERAYFIGLSWGGRVGFGIGEHAPHRASSLIIGGNQPYACPDSPLARIVSEGLRAARRDGMEALVRAMEVFWVPGFRRSRASTTSTTIPPLLTRRGQGPAVRGRSQRTLGRGGSAV